ncbi:hypothetical protein GCM10010195_07220 [Kitasatospora griseola]|nr:hypothetical protein GCM10010195_07220 [Kitasatospora griseola]
MLRPRKFDLCRCCSAGSQLLAAPVLHLEQQSGVGHGLVEGLLGDGLSLRLIGFQQARFGPPLDNACQFPAQVVRIGDAGVHAQTPDDGHRVRGIAGQQNPAVAEAFGDEPVHHPVLDPQHVDRYVGVGAQGARDQAGPVGPSGVFGCGSEPGPASLRVEREERSVRREVDAGGSAGAPAVEVGVEHDGGEAPDRSRAGGVDSQPLPDRGARAVGGDDMAGTDLNLLTAPVVDKQGHDALGLLDQVDELGPEPHRRVRGGEKRGFQPVLRGDHADYGALRDRRVDPDHRRGGEVAVAQGVAEADAAVLRCECVGRDPGGKPELAKDLHRAHVDQPGPGKR